MRTNSPPDLTPLNIKAYLNNGFNICGCTEIKTVIYTIRELLLTINNKDKNHAWYSEMHDQDGVYYIIAGILDRLGLIEYGTSIRFPWLTENGLKLLNALNNLKIDEIDTSEGEAYDGNWHENWHGDT